MSTTTALPGGQDATDTRGLDAAGTTFDLRAIVREVVDSSTEPDPHVLVDEVLNRIPAKFTRAALRICLAQYVRIYVGQERRGSAPAPKAEQQPSTRSWKVQAIGDMWQREIRKRIEVGAGNTTEWKLYGDCTRDDLLAVAAKYGRQSEYAAANASKIKTIVALLDEHGAETVKDLPAEARSLASLGSAS